MVSLETSYMGLKLKSPIIVGSSGLTNSVENIREAASFGAGAVVLKSLFEEQIMHQADHTLHYGNIGMHYPEAEDYIRNYTRSNDVENYLQLIRESKKAVNIPVIASINCLTSSEWVDFASRMEDAGADAIELNVFVLPSDVNRSSEQNEAVYFDVASKVLQKVKIPVSLKISHYFSALAQTAVKLSWAGVSGLVLFNRFYSLDIDIEHFELRPAHVFSSPAELATSLRWVAMLSAKISCDIAASTGCHDGKSAVKQLLAGAKAVQVASVLYKKGFREIEIMNNEIREWMERHEFQSLNQFVGRMSVKPSENSAAYERVQFMKHFSGID
ncbi:dihydroorotate dehydrogenase-like protein [Bacteroidales bacterium]